MPQPLEFKLTVTRPGPAVGFWDAFASTVGRLIVPAAGQTTLEEADTDISNSVRHIAFTEECSGEALPEEKMLTAQFSAAGWADIRGEVRETYAGVKDEIVLSGFAATAPLRPKPLTAAAPIFRYKPRPDEERLVPIAGAELEIDADAASAAVTLERWLLTPQMEVAGIVAGDIADLLNDIMRAFEDLRRQAPGGDPRMDIIIPTTNLIPSLEQLLNEFRLK